MKRTGNPLDGNFFHWYKINGNMGFQFIISIRVQQAPLARETRFFLFLSNLRNQRYK